MKIDYVSDLHLEFGIEKLSIIPDAEVLVMAGDIMEVHGLLKDRKQDYSDWLISISNKYKWIVWVMGNHEYYNGTFDYCIDQLKTVIEELGVGNIRVLQNETLEIDDCIFWGATMWTSINNEHPVMMQSIAHAMNDYKCINKMRVDSHAVDRLRTSDTVEEHKKSIQSLKDFIKLKSDKKKIVVAHHAPSFKSISKNHIGDYLNDAYATDLYDVYFDSKILVSFHGHIHEPVDYVLGKTRVLSNPRGYYGYELQSKTYSVKTVEV